MPHQLVSINSLIEEYDVDIYSISFKENTESPADTNNFKSYTLRDFSRTSLLRFIINIQPDFMVVAGWAVSDFVWVSRKVQVSLNIPIVAYSDTQWRSTFRQKINSLFSKWYLRGAFTHLWVAGFYQYEYARKLGFPHDKIIFNALSCDIQLFNQCSIEQKKKKYPKIFLFVGRFVEDKGLDLLMAAWEKIIDKKGWTITLVGSGHLKQKFINKSGVLLKEFMSQNALLSEMQQAGCFILPSIFEPWALVIHEAVASGLPIIATNVCGAAPHLIISGYNGYQVNPCWESIKIAMEKVINMDSDQLINFSENSRKIAQSITPKLGSAQLMSLLDAK